MVVSKSFFLLALLFIGLAWSTQAQNNDEKYKAIQGIGYLHTQTSLLLTNWDIHPLNHKPMDEQEAVFQEHLIEEIEHDEEWAEYVLVEDNLFDGPLKENISDEVRYAIETNIAFYLKILKAIRDPELMKKNRKLWQKEMVDANKRLYDEIFPALVK